MLWYSECWGSHIREWEMLKMMRMELASFYTVEVAVERMEDVEDDAPGTYNIILYSRGRSGAHARCRRCYASRDEGVDFLVAGPRSAVINVKW